MPLVTDSGISPLSNMAPTADVAVPGGRRRGRYKIFLGMAAGVGKTYRMLQEGQAEAESGRDVVIGYIEPHDRQDTSSRLRVSR
jgi:two-component system, OmpR family, sensor histidine kinase KdpD